MLEMDRNTLFLPQKGRFDFALGKVGFYPGQSRSLPRVKFRFARSGFPGCFRRFWSVNKFQNLICRLRYLAVSIGGEP